MKRDIGDLVIREAQEADANAMASYAAGLVAEELDTLTKQQAPSAEGERLFVQKARSAERAFILLAIRADEVVGLLDVWAGERPEFRHLASFGMSVANGHRRSGIGRQLLKAAIAETLKWDGFCRIELEVAAWNAPAIALYRSSGFSVEARKAKAVNLRGQPEDTLLMALIW